MLWTLVVAGNGGFLLDTPHSTYAARHCTVALTFPTQLCNSSSPPALPHLTRIDCLPISHLHSVCRLSFLSIFLLITRGSFRKIPNHEDVILSSELGQGASHPRAVVSGQQNCPRNLTNERSSSQGKHCVGGVNSPSLQPPLLTLLPTQGIIKCLQD